MHLVTTHWVSKLAGYSLRFRDFLRLEAFSLQHVEEIGIPAKVELVGPIQPHTALPKQISKHAMNNRRANLGFDVIAEERQTPMSETLLPLHI